MCKLRPMISRAKTDNKNKIKIGVLLLFILCQLVSLGLQAYVFLTSNSSNNCLKRHWRGCPASHLHHEPDTSSVPGRQRTEQMWLCFPPRSAEPVAMGMLQGAPQSSHQSAAGYRGKPGLLPRRRSWDGESNRRCFCVSVQARMSICTAVTQKTKLWMLFFFCLKQRILLFCYYFIILF